MIFSKSNKTQTIIMRNMVMFQEIPLVVQETFVIQVVGNE